jgi:hypothetical protein
LRLLLQLRSCFRWRRYAGQSRKARLWTWTLAPALCVFVGFSVFVFAQNSGENAAQTSLDGSRIVPFLNQTLVWYRQMMVVRQIANDPSEVTIVSDNRQLSEQIVRLSFDFARAEADAIASSQRSTQAQEPNGGSPEQQAIAKAESQVDQQIKSSESELNWQRRLASSDPSWNHRSQKLRVRSTLKRRAKMPSTA